MPPNNASSASTIKTPTITAAFPLECAGATSAIAQRSGSAALDRLRDDDFESWLPGLREGSQLEAVELVMSQIFGAPFVVHTNSIAASTSVDVWVYESSGTTPADAAIRYATVATSRVRSRWGKQHCVFDSRGGSRASRRAARESLLRDTIEHETIACHYQPIVDPESCEISGAETLARWSTPSDVGPTREFIPLAEDTGMILPLGGQLLDRAVEDTSG
ncbi:MAG: putative signal transduction protein with EAL and GGDEF domain [Bradymonadia bacterium]|jgi:predicted signal transduction protein with EAL and GGDEF domain